MFLHFSVGLCCWAVIVDKADHIVELIARAYHMKLPTILSIYFLLTLSIDVDVSSGIDNSESLTYFLGFTGNGECCGFSGI